MSIPSFDDKVASMRHIRSELEKSTAIELEKLLTQALRMPGTRHYVLANFLQASDAFLRTLASSDEELAICNAVKTQKANALRDLLGLTAKYC